MKDCWTAIVDTAKWAQKDLPGVLAKVKPDMVCVDNVILFPAIKQSGKPWVRIISCSENEIEDEDIPPHLSGCGESDKACHAAYRDRFNEVIGPIHADFNAFLEENGEAPYPIGQFFEASPYHEPAALSRAGEVQAPPRRSIRSASSISKAACASEKPYEVPRFAKNNDGPLIYVSFGSLGAGDTELLKRIIAAIGKTRYRALVNVGGYQGAIFRRAAERHHRELVPAALGHSAGRRRHPPRRQQLLHRVPLFRQAGDHHALCLGRPRQRHARPGDRPRLQDAALRLDRGAS